MELRIMKPKIFLPFVIFFLIVFLPVFVRANVVKGKVVGIVDGDTITVLTVSKAQKQIRIRGIDAPEKDQTFGVTAREQLTQLILNKKIVVEYENINSEQQILGKIICENKDVGLEMIRGGFAWFYKEHESELSKEDASLYSVSEVDAQAKSVGLWKNLNPQSPWKFREQSVKEVESQIPNSASPTKGFSGKVTEILDGIKISIMKSDYSRMEICISNLEIPEPSQPYADVAEQHLKDLLLEQIVTINIKGFVEEDGCLLGDVYLKNININLQMVRDGVAWSNKDYFYPEGYYSFEEAEKAARSERRGIWLDNSPIAPWIYREEVYRYTGDTLSVGASNGNIGNTDGTGSSANRTVRVRGYYKQNGTYVRSHTRSSPGSRSNSGGGRRHK